MNKFKALKDQRLNYFRKNLKNVFILARVVRMGGKMKRQMLN